MALRWQHRASPTCAPFDALEWWAQPPTVWRTPADADGPAEVFELRACPRCGSHISARALVPVYDGATS